MEVCRGSVRQEILCQVKRRGVDKTICPSEVARTVGTSETWRDLMDLVRDVGCELAREGYIHVTQKGKIVEDPQQVRGPIRYRLVAS
mmetsp:Transcript_10823/g.18303  ORF Transcript_10823/g.18303 Transcript_10823/m.18303 type:complete len:87 (+) Transcript_10823:208-468(+)